MKHFFSLLTISLIFFVTASSAPAQLKQTVQQTTPSTNQSSPQPQSTFDNPSTSASSDWLTTPSGIEVRISGTISDKNFRSGQTGKVEFNRFPSTVAEWKEVRELIGRELHGAVALQLMVSEVYQKNFNAGKECANLNAVTSTAPGVLRRLDDLYRYDPTRPYQAAAYLTGADWSNGYNPTKPYTIEFRVGTNNRSQYSNTYQSDVFSFQIKSNGHEGNNGWQPVSVVKTMKPGQPGENGAFYIITECSSIYLRCKEASFTVPFKGLD